MGRGGKHKVVVATRKKKKDSSKDEEEFPFKPPDGFIERMMGDKGFLRFMDAIMDG